MGEEGFQDINYGSTVQLHLLSGPGCSQPGGVDQING